MIMVGLPHVYMPSLAHSSPFLPFLLTLTPVALLLQAPTRKLTVAKMQAEIRISSQPPCRSPR